MPFTIGHKINVGRKMPAHERRKHSISMSGKLNHRYGVEPWNKGKKCPQISNENNGCWKWEGATYAAKHIWVRVHFGKAVRCDNQQCSGKSNNYHWANISGEYKRIRSDWTMLCVPCHKKFDKEKR